MSTASVIVQKVTACLFSHRSLSSAMAFHSPKYTEREIRQIDFTDNSALNFDTLLVAKKVYVEGGCRRGRLR